MNPYAYMRSYENFMYPFCVAVCAELMFSMQELYAIDMLPYLTSQYTDIALFRWPATGWSLHDCCCLPLIQVSSKGAACAQFIKRLKQHISRLL